MEDMKWFVKKVWNHFCEKAYLVHCTVQLPVMWMHKERYDIR